MKIADAWINLQTKIAGFKQNLTKAKASWRNFAKDINYNIKKIEKNSKYLNFALNKIKWAFIGLGAGVGILTRSFVKSSAEMERYSKMFTILYGDADIAAKKLRDVARFAALTPFELPEVINATRLLKVFGVETEETLRIIGDAAAAVSQPIEEVALWFGRIAAGDVGRGLMRLREMGLITKEMLEGKGLEFDKGGAYKGSINVLMAAITDILKTKFMGMMDEMSTSWEGMLSNLSDFWFQIKAKIGDVILPYLKERLKKLLDTLDEWTESGKLDKYVTQIGGKILTTFQLIEKGIKTIVKYRVQIMAVVNGLLAFTAALKIGAVILKFTLAIKAAGTVFGAFTALIASNPLGILAAAIGVVVGAITILVNKYSSWGEVIDWLWHKIKLFSAYIIADGQVAKQYFISLGKTIKNIMKGDFLGASREMENFNQVATQKHADLRLKMAQIDADYQTKKFNREMKAISAVRTEKDKNIATERKSISDLFNTENEITDKMIEAQKDAANKRYEILHGEFESRKRLALEDYERMLSLGVEKQTANIILQQKLSEIDRDESAHRISIVEEEVEKKIEKMKELGILSAEDQRERLLLLRDEVEEGTELWTMYTDKINELSSKISSAWDTEFDKAIGRITSSLSSSLSKMLKNTRTFASGVKAIFESLKNTIIDIIADIAAKWAISGILSAAGLPTGVIPGFATGAVVFKKTMANVAENEPEAVIPFSKLAAALRESDIMDHTIPSLGRSISGEQANTPMAEKNVNLSIMNSFDGAVITDDDTLDTFYEKVILKAMRRYKEKLSE